VCIPPNSSADLELQDGCITACYLHKKPRTLNNMTRYSIYADMVNFQTQELVKVRAYLRDAFYFFYGSAANRGSSYVKYQRLYGERSTMRVDTYK